jgi:hypothetical protein
MVERNSGREWAKMMPRELLTIAPSPWAIEAGGDFGGAGALCTIAGDEQPGVRHGGAEFG